MKLLIDDACHDTHISRRHRRAVLAPGLVMGIGLLLPQFSARK
jgi:hypothetical protein